MTLTEAGLLAVIAAGSTDQLEIGGDADLLATTLRVTSPPDPDFAVVTA